MESDSEFERQQEAAAAAEAAKVGGEPGIVPGYDDDPTTPGLSEDPARRPVEEAGGGGAEGFELAEDELVARGENPRGASPVADHARICEDERAETEYGESDSVRTSEDDPESADGNW